jgi:hypothetical protein
LGRAGALGRRSACTTFGVGEACSAFGGTGGMAEVVSPTAPGVPRKPFCSTGCGFFGVSRDAPEDDGTEGDGSADGTEATACGAVEAPEGTATRLTLAGLGASVAASRGASVRARFFGFLPFDGGESRSSLAASLPSLEADADG